MRYIRYLLPDSWDYELTLQKFLILKHKDLEWKLELRVRSAKVTKSSDQINNESWN